MPRISVIGPRSHSLKCLVRSVMACLIASRDFDAKVISSTKTGRMIWTSSQAKIETAALKYIYLKPKDLRVVHIL